MSLIRMLTTTRSLSDVKNEPSPYRMSGQALLPKFGPRQKAREAGSPPPHVGGYKADAAKETLGEGKGDRTDAGCSLKLEGNRKPQGLAAWLRSLLGRAPRRERREPVQAEFALDLVKVVRNDLSEVDAEPRKGKPEKSALKTEQQPEENVFSAPVR